ncbi:hypothetical protein [Pseudonocardia sp.]|jgi:hypothetical protein|uniref:hypothetical protein n=1 Tax=Pseudonocardia sp. TaxID=60912 RepID=UPI00262024E0|nr:hypothetical protein [Pseudonocardia sp.]MCW2718476.1 hypothetical protein [Pseudonocardia sp.]
MPAPYEQGQPLAWIEIDTEGVRVHRARVEAIEPSATTGSWHITTERGSTTVDASGVAPSAVPLEPDIADDLYLYGDGYLVTSSLIGLEFSADMDTTVERGDDLDLG